MIAHGQFFLQPAEPGSRRGGGLVDTNFLKFSESMLQISGNDSDKDIATKLWASAKDVKWSHSKSYYNAVGTGYYLPVIYIPHAVGLLISRKLDLDMRTSYELTRALVVATSLSLLALALSIYTPNVLSLMLLVTPMTLFQLSSPTIDGLCAAMALLAIGLWLNVSVSEHYLTGAKPPAKEIVLYGLVIVLCTARTNLLPMLLIPLWLAFARPSGWRVVAVALVCLFTLGWIAFTITTIHDSRLVREYSTSSIFIKYLSNPIEFYNLLAGTLGDEDVRRFYRDSYFGILGWLDTPIPRQTVRIMYAVSGITAVALGFFSPWRHHLRQRALLVLMGAASAFLIFLALAIAWTNYPAEKISGIQGRYFFIPTLLLVAALGKMHTGVRNLRPAEVVLFCSFLAYSLYTLATTLAGQYKLVALPI